MSEKDSFDWNDDLDYQEMPAGQKEVDSGDEPLDDFSDIEDFPEYGDYCDEPLYEDDVVSSEPEPEEVEEPQTAPQPSPGFVPHKSPGVVNQGAWLGTLVFLCILVVIVGIGGGLLMSMGIDPLQVWSLSNLTQVGTWLDFQGHPENLILVIALGSLLLAGMTAGVVARSIRNISLRLETSRTMLSRLTSLRLDREEQWLDPEFKADPDAAAFTEETLGAWRHNEARLRRLVATEGEMRRLEKALSSNSREDMVREYEVPAAGMLADSVLRLFDECESLGQENSTRSKAHADSGQALMTGIQGARGWNTGTKAALAGQVSRLDGLSDKVMDLAGKLTEAADGLPDYEAMSAQLAQVHNEITQVPAADHTHEEKLMNRLQAAVDKTAKLAFQIAMEVARLGAGGDRLLPLAQSLEELTSEFRSSYEGIEKAHVDGGGHAARHAHIMQLVNSLRGYLSGADGVDYRAHGDLARQVGAGLAQSMTGLGTLAGCFDEQEGRLCDLGGVVAGITGTAFDPNEADQGAGPNLEQTGLDVSGGGSFSLGGDSPSAPVDVDPFASGSGSQQSPEDSGFTTSSVPGAQKGFSLGPSEPSTESELPPAEDPVYDLDVLGGVALDQESVPEAEVFDLTDFGATRIEEADQTQEESETVCDLSAFGAVRLN